MKRIALIGDIVESKKLKNRGAVQKRIDTIFRDINNRDKYLLSKFTITLGDEFQAVYQRADSIFMNSFRLMAELYPVKIRFSFGVGEITTELKKKAIGMDGPAFYNAREGMEKLKKTNYNFYIADGLADTFRFERYTLNLISHMIEGWNQNRFFTLLLLFEGKDKKEIAGRLKISERAVYKTIKSGALDNVIKIGKEISQSINRKL